MSAKDLYMAKLHLIIEYLQGLKISNNMICDFLNSNKNNLLVRSTRGNFYYPISTVILGDDNEFLARPDTSDGYYVFYGLESPGIYLTFSDESLCEFLDILVKCFDISKDDVLLLIELNKNAVRWVA